MKEKPPSIEKEQKKLIKAKREQIAPLVLAALLSNSAYYKPDPVKTAKAALLYTDSLINELNK